MPVGHHRGHVWWVGCSDVGPSVHGLSSTSPGSGGHRNRRWRALRNSQRSGVRCTRVRRTYFRGGETPRGMRGVIGKQAILEVAGFTRLRGTDRFRPATTPSESSPVDATTRTNPTTIASHAKLEDGPCASPRNPVAKAKAPVAISRRVTLQSKRPALRPMARSYARLATTTPRHDLHQRGTGAERS